MNEKVDFKAFPEDMTDALALAYVTAQDLSKRSPEEIARLYSDAHQKISNEFKAIAKEKKASLA